MGKTHYTAVLYHYLSQLRWSRHWEGGGGGGVKLLALSLYPSLITEIEGNVQEPSIVRGEE